MRLALAVVSLLVMIGSGVVVYDQSNSRWEDNQRAYFHQALELAKTPAERTALEVAAAKDRTDDRDCLRRNAHRSLRKLPHRSGRSALCFRKTAAADTSLLGCNGRRLPQWPLGAPPQIH